MSDTSAIIQFWHVAHPELTCLLVARVVTSTVKVVLIVAAPAHEHRRAASCRPGDDRLPRPRPYRRPLATRARDRAARSSGSDARRAMPGTPPQLRPADSP